MLRDIKCFLKQFFFSTISNFRFLNGGKFETQKKRKEKAKKLERKNKNANKIIVSLKNIWIDRGTNGQISLQSYLWFVRV